MLCCRSHRLCSVILKPVLKSQHLLTFFQHFVGEQLFKSCIRLVKGSTYRGYCVCSRFCQNNFYHANCLTSLVVLKGFMAGINSHRYWSYGTNAHFKVSFILPNCYISGVVCLYQRTIEPASLLLKYILKPYRSNVGFAYLDDNYHYFVKNIRINQVLLS